MGQFTKKPVTVEAVQFHKAGDHPAVEVGFGGGYVIDGRQGFVAVREGDWIIAEMDGKGFYPCAPDVFAATYEPARAADPNALSFGDALVALKAGHRVCRAGWNGKGMWLALSGPLEGREIAFENFWSKPCSEFARLNGGSAKVLPCINMKTADGGILMGWLASQTDMLAEDWMILPVSDRAHDDLGRVA